MVRLGTSRSNSPPHFEIDVEVSPSEKAVGDLCARELMHGPNARVDRSGRFGARNMFRAARRRRDTHRVLSHCIAKGADLERMLTELLAKETGYWRGRGESMRIADVASGNPGANGIVGGGLPIAAGAGLAYQLRGTVRVIVNFFGDGASNEGAFHEAVNLAAIWKLPVIFVCANNKYGMSVSTGKSMVVETIGERGAAYGLPCVSVDGNCVEAVHAAVTTAVDRARAGQRLTLDESLTYRWKGHSKSERTSTSPARRSPSGATGPARPLRGARDGQRRTRGTSS